MRPRKGRRRIRILTALAASLLAGAAPAQDSGTLLIGNKGEDTVSFVALDGGRELGRAAPGKAPHEIAVSPNGRQAAVVAYGGKSIALFDIGTRRKVRTIDLGANEGPHGLVWLRDGRLVATTERSRSLTIVDPRSGDAVTAIPTDQEGTHMVAVSPDARRAYTANMKSATVTVIDLANGSKIGDVAIGGTPEGIALSPNGKTLWVGDNAGARVTVFDTAALDRKPSAARPTAVVTVGDTPIRVIASPDGRWIVTSNLGGGSLTVIDAATRTVARTIPVSGAREAGQVTILFSDDGGRLYVAETGRDEVAEVDFASGKVLRRLKAGKNGDGLAIAP